MPTLTLKERIAKIKEQEKTFGVKIHLEEADIWDLDHLDCLWYGGQVGYIEYKGYKIVIEADGDVRLNGMYKGQELFCKDKQNLGRAHQDIAVDHNINDKVLYELMDNGDESKDFIRMEDNNWFEVDVITPDGKFYDLCNCDNILDNNVLECFESVDDYFEYVDGIIKEKDAEQNGED